MVLVLQQPRGLVEPPNRRVKEKILLLQQTVFLIILGFSFITKDLEGFMSAKASQAKQIIGACCKISTYAYHTVGFEDLIKTYNCVFQAEVIEPCVCNS